MFHKMFHISNNAAPLQPHKQKFFQKKKGIDYFEIVLRLKLWQKHAISFVTKF